MAVVLALLSALAYGLSDFLGGFVSRRTSAWAVAVVSQTSSAVCVGLLALVVDGTPRPVDFAWALLAGVGTGGGMGFLYRGFAVGRISVVAPISAVGAAVIPVAVGAATGERPGPLVWFGVLLALPGVWLVSGGAPEGPTDRGPASGGVLEGVLAGLGFGGLFAALGQIPDGSGWAPLFICQVVGVPVVVVLAVLLRAPWVPRGRGVRLAVLGGPLGASATGLFLLASQRGYLTVTGLLASLYPASTVLLAVVVLRERVHRAQAIGLALCAVAVALVAVG